MKPDIGNILVRRPDGSRHRISFLDDEQPFEDGVLHARLQAERFAPADSVSTRCVLETDGWRDDGPVLSAPDPSAHPDLPASLAAYVRTARAVASEIGFCHGVNICYDPHRGRSEDRIMSSVMFLRRSTDNPSKADGFVEDRILDRVPDVRHLERRAILAADFLGLKIYDDASGITGTTEFQIGPTDLLLSHEDDDGAKLTIRSSFSDGSWTHSTTVHATPPEDDAVSMMRHLNTPGSWLDSLLEQDSAIATILKSGSPEICSVDVSAEHPSVTFHVRPGSLIRSTRTAP